MRSLLENKKGSIVASIMFVVSVAAFAIFLLVVGYIGSTIGTELKAQINSTNSDVNNAFDKTIVTSTQTLSTLWYIMFGLLMFGVFVSAWYTRDYPILVPVYIILLIISVIVGAAMSNAYEAISEASQFTATSAQQVAIQFMMNNLPYIALVIGLIAIVLAFAKPDSIGGGGVIG